MGLSDFANPMSAIGDLNIKIQDVARQVHGKADNYELTSLRRDVADLERTVRELSSTIVGLRDELQAVREGITADLS